MLLISYQLRRPRSYHALLDAIKRLGTWVKPLESLWLVKTDRGAVEVRNQLSPLIDKEDYLLVVDVPSGGYLAAMNSAEENCPLKEFVEG